MKIVCFWIALVPCLLFSQYTITVHVHNIRSALGDIKVATYDSAAAFLSHDSALRTSSASAHTGKVTLNIEDLPAGKYALGIFHDANANGKLDTNWLGIPKEKVGFSKGKMRPFGPPRYKDCTFTITSDYEIDIVL